MEQNKKIWLPIIITLAVLIAALVIMIIVVKVSGSATTEPKETESVEDTEITTEVEDYDEYFTKDLDDFSVGASGSTTAVSDGESVTGDEPSTEEGDMNPLENPDGYLLPSSDTVALTEADLEGMTAQELTYARNEIYARHGRVFQSEELNTYFLTKLWYTPDENFEDSSLSSMETANADFILQYQTDNDLSYTAQ